PMHQRDSVAVNRVRQRQQFKIAEVRRQYKSAAAFGQLFGLLPMLLAFVNRIALDIGAIELAHVGPLRNHPPPVAIHPANYLEARFVGQFWKGDFQVLDRDRPVRPIQLHHHPAQSSAQLERSFERKTAQRGNAGGDTGVFDPGLDPAYLSRHRHRGARARARPSHRKKGLVEGNPQGVAGLSAARLASSAPAPPPAEAASELVTGMPSPVAAVAGAAAGPPMLDGPISSVLNGVSPEPPLGGGGAGAGSDPGGAA